VSRIKIAHHTTLFIAADCRASQVIALFVVTDCFQIGDRGCVLVPGLSTAAGSPVVRTGAAIQLRTPDGRVIDTHIRGIEMINYRQQPEKMTAPILLPPDVRKEEVPPGTEVFLVVDAPGG
jgi:hypothetical protein